jgi:hypothetical protein
MKNLTLTLLAAAAIGAISMGTASAMPISHMATARGDSLVQDVRLVCDRYHRCYDNHRAYRGRPYAQRYYGRPTYYAQPGYVEPGYGYYGGPRVGIGIGPFGLGVF